MKYTIDIKRYSFIINFDKNRHYSGLYWKALADNRSECGKIDFQFVNENNNILVETSFTPEKVDIFPILANSKIESLNSSLIHPSKWVISFCNIQSSNSTIRIFGTKPGQYKAYELIQEDIKLDEIKTMNLNFISTNIYDKILLKKSNSNNDQIIISDVKLVNFNNKKLMSDTMLIKPESEYTKKEGVKIYFEESAPLWSFVSVKFYSI